MWLCIEESILLLAYWRLSLKVIYNSILLIYWACRYGNWVICSSTVQTMGSLYTFSSWAISLLQKCVYYIVDEINCINTENKSVGFWCTVLLSSFTLHTNSASVQFISFWRTVAHWGSPKARRENKRKSICCLLKFLKQPIIHLIVHLFLKMITCHGCVNRDWRSGKRGTRKGINNVEPINYNCKIYRYSYS